MKDSKFKRGANILPIIKTMEEDHFKPAEVARNLFSETWRIYLDETPMKSVSIKQASGADFESNNTNYKMDISDQPLRLYFKD